MIFPKSGFHLFLSSIAVLVLVVSPVIARDRSLPTCDDLEHIEKNDDSINRQIPENCEHTDESRSLTGKQVGADSGLGLVVGGLALVGLAAAGGGGGSGGETTPDSDNIPTPAPAPLPPFNTAPLPIPSNPDNLGSWRTEEFNNQYGLGLIGIEHRFAQGARGQGTLGAIYDSGIDLGHIDVGRIKTELSHSYGENSSDLSDPVGHGTHVYGIAGATRNGTGIHGVAPDADFMIIKQKVNPNGSANFQGDFANALRRAMDAGADAMNNSWATAGSIHIDDFISRPGRLLAALGPTMIKQLRRTAKSDISIVFSTGNNNSQDSTFWASLPSALPELAENWIAVTALDDFRDFKSAKIAGYANNCGNAFNWCLAAPGTNIVSLGAGEGDEDYVIRSGTSMAAPHVMGAVLVLKSQFPEMTTSEVHQILFDTAVDLGAPGLDTIFGHGALNFNEALAPQGAMTAELGETVDETTIPLSESWMKESAITGGALASALSDQNMLVTDGYDRGYFANLGSRVAIGLFGEAEARTDLAVAFSRAGDTGLDLAESGLDLRFNAFGSNYDVTRVAHADPVMSLVGQTKGTGFSMDVPVGKAVLSMASAVAKNASAVSLGAGMPFGDDSSVSVSFGRAREIDGILGARAYGAFAGLDSNTVYGRVQADIALGEHVALNGSLTAGWTSIRGDRLIVGGRADTRSMALGVSVNNALARGDKLSVALSRPFAVSGGELTLRNGTGISAAENNVRTDRISYAKTTVPLGKAGRSQEVHLGYLHGFETRRWDSAGLAFGGVARLNGGVRAAAARIELTLGF